MATKKTHRRAATNAEIETVAQAELLGKATRTGPVAPDQIALQSYRQYLALENGDDVRLAETR